MTRGRRHKPEQIVELMQQIQVGKATGKTESVACREAGISEQTYYRWCKEFGGLKVDTATHLMDLEQENAKLRRLVAELSLDNRASSGNRAENF